MLTSQHALLALQQLPWSTITTLLQNTWLQPRLVVASKLRLGLGVQHARHAGGPVLLHAPVA
jgi:hypothetical protein